VDDVFDVLGAAHVALRIREAERAAVAVRVVCVDDSRLERARSAETPRGLAGERHGQRGPAVIRVAQRDDFRRPRETARCQDRSLVCLGAAVREERLAQTAAGRDLDDTLGQRGLRLCGEDCRDVLRPVDLLVNPGIHFFIAVADADGENAVEKIQILVAVGVVNKLVFGAPRPAAPCSSGRRRGTEIPVSREGSLLWS